MADDRHASELEPRDHVDHRFGERLDAVRVAGGGGLFAFAEPRQIGREHAKLAGERPEHALELEMTHEKIVDQDDGPAAARLDDAHPDSPRRHVSRHPLDHRPRTIPKARAALIFSAFHARWTDKGPGCA